MPDLIKPARIGKKLSAGKHMRKVIYSLGFLLYLYVYLLIYINSSFLAKFVGDSGAGFVFTAGSVLAIVLFMIVPSILRRFGNVRIAVFSIFLLFLATMGLVYTESSVPIVVFFLGTLLLFRMASYSFDLFLEHESSDSETGSIRGIFLTITNVALVLAPLTTGFIVGDQGVYEKAYFVSGLLLIPLVFLISYFFKDFKDPEYSHFSFFKTAVRVLKNKDLRDITASNLILRIFYATMVIYTPIYLNQQIGFGWEKLGIIFTIMLLPFVLLEIPVGALADKKFGEKEFLTAGFIWVAVSTLFISFFTEPVFWVWALILFSTRVGASVVEIMTETYFFKKIDGDDSDILGFFRMVQPMAYIIAPLLAGIFLLFFDLRWLFIVLAFVVLLGTKFSLALKDTL